DNWQDDPQFKYRNFMPDHENSPLQEDNFRRFPIDCLMAEKPKTEKAPVLGRDTEDVLKGVGLSAGEISRLRDKRVI
ncbi:MAG: hypothetical protein ABII26_05430, partial [Pseudomonadota bacterium]